MFTFLQKFSAQNLRKVLMGVFKRMPVSFALSVATFILLLVRVEIDSGFSKNIQNILDKGIFSLVVMFFFSIAVYLFSESISASKISTFKYQISTFIFGAVFFYFFEENLFDSLYAEVFIYIILTMFGVVGSLFVAPFLLSLKQKNISQRKFYNHTYELVVKMIASVIVGNAAILLGLAGFAAIDILFDVSLGDNITRWVIFSATLFAPIFFLANIPTTLMKDTDKPEDSKFFSFLVRYVSLPAIGVYLLILYAYTAKVLLNFSDWPNGKVTWLVIGFSLFGYLVYIATYAFVEEFKPAKLFRKFFPFAVIPQVAMLFYAIFLRINQYDITINRYLVVVFGVWLLLISLHFVFSKKKYLGAVPLSLVIFIILMSVGPWSVYVYPESRQIKHLENVLQEMNMYKDGTVVPLKKYTDIPAKKSGEIYGAVRYLCDYHSCNSLTPLFSEEMSEIRKDDKEEFEKDKKERIEDIKKNVYKHSEKEISERVEFAEGMEYTPMRDWRMVQELTSMLKVKEYYGKDGDDWKVERYISFGLEGRSYDRVVNVTGYDYLVPFTELEMPGMSNERKNKLYSAVINNETDELRISKNSVVIDKISLRKVFDTLLPKQNKDQTDPDSMFGSRYNTNLLPEKDMTFILYGKKVKVKVIFSSVDIENPDWVDTNADSKEDGIKDIMIRDIRRIHGTVLIKEK